MIWSRRYQYCYGMELVEAARKVRRTDVTFLLVGDGSGMSQLEAKATGLPPGRVIFTGRVPQDKLPAYYAACDLASLPQTVDRVGSFRYTTKLSEYLAFGLPVLTGQIPLAYDLDDGWIWRLPGDTPWDRTYTTALAEVVDGLTADELQAKRSAVPRDHPAFDFARQARQVTAFIRDVYGATVN
jgi:glycosyltransferase involved in cell wall biosynthesis